MLSKCKECNCIRDVKFMVELDVKGSGEYVCQEHTEKHH